MRIQILFIIFSIILISNKVDAQCLGSQSHTITPAGPYNPGQTVTVSYTLSSFIQLNINWIHCFDLDLGAGWVNVTPITAPQNPGGSSGNWTWDNQHTFPSGINFGPGWRFINSSVANWGTSSTGPFTVSFDLVASQNCTPENLDIRMEVYGDCQTGGWSNGACCPIAPYTIYTGNSLGAGTVSIIDSANNISCYGYNDGSIYINPSGGLPPYSYQWSNGATTQNLTNIGPGSYSVTVTDAAGCISSISGLLITEPNQLQLNSNTLDINCFGNNNGSISISLSGGIPPISYNWSNGDTTQNVNNLSVGNYSLLITDGNGCAINEFYSIYEPNELYATNSITNVNCNGENNGSITFNIYGGTTNYMIDVAGFLQTLNTGNNLFATPSTLAANTYPVNITDSNGCVFLDTITITEPDSINVLENTQNVSCYGLNDGSSTLTISGGTPIYNENWGNINPAALNAGIYNYVITDNNGCLFTDSIIIYEPLILNHSVLQTNVSTCLGFDGSIDITVNGGVNPYTFLWNNGQTTEDLTNMSAGYYSLTITDSNGCIDTFSTTITQPSAPTLSNTHVNASCFGFNDGSINLNITGGTSPFSYLWSNNTTTQNINNISAGTYNVVVTDSNNCISTMSITITQPTAISVIPATSNVSCNGLNDGLVNLIISGGFSPYTEDWGIYNPLTLSAGNYTYTITDSVNCTYINQITITEPPILTTIPLITDVKCKNGNDGHVLLNTTGGVSPYTEDWGTYNPTNLNSGTYLYIITDFNGCIFSDSITISEPDSLLTSHVTTDVRCFGGNTGTATITITGGTPPYSENWGLSNPDSLIAGIHSYTITDYNGCIYSNQITIFEPLGINISVDTFRVSCFGFNDGYATLTVTGGNPPYTEDWNGINPNALYAGIHDFTVTDSNNCIYQGQAIISQPNDIIINEIISHVSCFGDNDGTVQLQIYGGNPPFTQDWNGVNTIMLSEGYYTYTVTDTKGCTKSNFIHVNQPDTLRAKATVIDANCFNSNDGQVYLNYQGGTSPFTTDWLGYNPLALSAGTYSFSIIDNNGCRFDSTIIINQANEVLLSFSGRSPICKNDTTQLIIDIINPTSAFYIVVIEDSLNTYQYIIDSTGMELNTQEQISMTPSQNTNFIITYLEDENGCFSNPNLITNILVNQLPLINLNINDVCEQTPSFILDQATPSGGTYYLNGEKTSYVDVENLSVGSYSIKYDYTDSISLCHNSKEIIINIDPSPNTSFSINPNIVTMENPNVLFTNSTNDIISINWLLINGNDTLTITDSTSFWHTYRNSGKQYIKLITTNIYGCTDTLIDSVLISPIKTTYMPNIFTPNNDNINDTFGPELNGQDSYRLMIYNRWGIVIFDKKNTHWDGLINGEIASAGMYSYFIETVDTDNMQKKYVGNVLLAR
ncbi:MAG: gliding motility-associated C-terminal domain-containing protein [Bacteroidota bacterium]|nr:gliding motility-associated C-terminal domain-containing protein [Bacteroidota bacterium]